MPFYEYQCQACGEHVEVLQKISEPPLVVCPACEKPELKKQISAAGFRLKGGGWYETDFKNAKQKNLHETADSKPASKSESASDGKGPGSDSSSSATKAASAPVSKTSSES